VAVPWISKKSTKISLKSFNRATVVTKAATFAEADL